jgi:hypothetical protein
LYYNARVHEHIKYKMATKLGVCNLKSKSYLKKPLCENRIESIPETISREVSAPEDKRAEARS